MDVWHSQSLVLRSTDPKASSPKASIMMLTVKVDNGECQKVVGNISLRRRNTLM